MARKALPPSSSDQVSPLGPALTSAGRSPKRAKSTVKRLPAVCGGVVSIAATIGRRAIAFALAGATDLGEKWTDAAKHPIVMHDGDTIAEVILVRPLSMLGHKPSAEEQRDLAEAHRRWREIDQVTLDLLVNAAAEHQPDEKHRWFLSYDHMLDARGLQKRKKLELRENRADTGAVYTAGHRSGDREEQHQSVLRVVNMGAMVTGKPRSRRVMIPPTIVLHEFEFDFLSGAPTGIKYELGSWIDAFAIRNAPRIPAKALTYDPYREVIESRLARLLTILLANKGGAPLTVGVRAVVEEIHAQMGGDKVMRRLIRVHRALEALARDEIFASWRLTPSLADRPLPARDFLDDWLERSFVIVPCGATVGENAVD